MTAIPLPRLSLERIQRVKDRVLADMTLASMVGDVLEADQFDDFVTALTKSLPGNIEREPVYQSVLDLAGTELTYQRLHDTAWRLAGNVHRLRTWHPAPAWSAQARKEWVPIIILSGHLKYTRGGKKGVVYEYAVLAGSPTGKVFTKFWLAKFLYVLSGRIGYSKPYNSRPYRDPMDLVNMQFYVLLAPELCTDGLDFEEIKANNYQIKANQQLMLDRRRDKRPCPRGLPRAFPCYRCQFGLDVCPNAVHEHTFVRRYCSQCDSSGWFDPGHKNMLNICVNCWHKHIAKASFQRRKIKQTV